jgi:hypothetical protein
MMPLDHRDAVARLSDERRHDETDRSAPDLDDIEDFLLHGFLRSILSLYRNKIFSRPSIRHRRQGSFPA